MVLLDFYLLVLVALHARIWGTQRGGRIRIIFKEQLKLIQLKPALKQGTKISGFAKQNC